MEPNSEEYKRWKAKFIYLNNIDTYYTNNQIDKFFNDIKMFFKLAKNKNIVDYDINLQSITFPDVEFYIYLKKNGVMFDVKIAMNFETEDDRLLAEEMSYDSRNRDNEHNYYFLKQIINQL